MSGISGWVHQKNAFAAQPADGSGSRIPGIRSYKYDSRSNILTLQFDSSRTLCFSVNASGDATRLTDKQIAKAAVQLLAAASNNAFEHLNNIDSLKATHGQTPTVGLKSGAAALPEGNQLYHARNATKKDGSTAPSAVSGYDRYSPSTSPALNAQSTAQDRIAEAFRYVDYRLEKQPLAATGSTASMRVSPVPSAGLPVAPTSPSRRPHSADAVVSSGAAHSPVVSSSSPPALVQSQIHSPEAPLSPTVGHGPSRSASARALLIREAQTDVLTISSRSRSPSVDSEVGAFVRGQDVPSVVSAALVVSPAAPARSSSVVRAGGGVGSGTGVSLPVKYKPMPEHLKHLRGVQRLQINVSPDGGRVFSRTSRGPNGKWSDWRCS